MVRQRTQIRSRLWLQDINHDTETLVNDSMRSVQQHHKRFVSATFRHLFICFTSTSGFIIFVFLMARPENNAIIVRNLLLSKKYVNDLLLSSLNHTHNKETNMMTNKTNMYHTFDVVTKSSNTNSPLEEQLVALSVQSEKSVRNYTPDLSISSDDNKNRSHEEIDACYLMKNEADIRQCFNSHNVKKFSDARCQEIRKWSDVQNCLMKRYHYPNIETNSSTIREVHVIGERNSGTKFVTQFLQQCFPQTSGVRVHRDFIRSKHFFQPIYSDIDYTHSLIVVVVRDPIEWMAAMLEYPYHSPSHVSGFESGQVVPLPWQEFVNKTWTTEASHGDSELNAEDRTKVSCNQGFRFDQVKPCLLSDDMLVGPPWNIPKRRVRGFYPVYEQRRGKPYDHLLQMRSDKIVNWILQIPLLVQIGGFIVVRYEDLLEQGNVLFLKQVNAIIKNKTIDSEQSLPEHCPVISPQPDRIGKRYIPADFKKWISQNLDLESEELIGYR